MRIFRQQDRCRVLGPGTRAVIWVQGCFFACKGCLVQESWDPSGGYAVEPSELARWILSLEGIEGVTFSGGEPFAQAEALLQIVDQVRQQRDLGFMSYTGYPLEWLRRHGRGPQKQLLQRLDLLIDGRYRQDLHADLVWRGSSNQKIRRLTDRYQLPALDQGQGLEYEFGPDGGYTFSGVPPWPAYRESLPA